MRTYPAYLDFTKPRMGHDFRITEECGEFDNKFKVLNTTIFFDPTSDDIHNGDVVYYNLPSKEVGMFRIMEIVPDEQVENTIYCKAVFCGYSLGKPSYFAGFLPSWEKYYPSKQLPPISKPPLWRTETIDDLRNNKKDYPVEDDGILNMGIFILGLILVGLVCSIIGKGF